MAGQEVDPVAEYRQFAAKCRENLDRSFGEHAELHGKSIECIDALAAWVEELTSRPEHSMLEIAVRELRFGVLACAQGQYRQAYMALRMSLELSIAAMLFATREVELREWQKGEIDIRWATLTDPKDGVFSERLTKACSPSLAGDASQIKGIAMSAYRECSDFVHGGAESALKLPDALNFDAKMLQKWHGQLVTALIPITYAMLVRYSHYRTIISTPAAATAVRTNLAGVTSAIEVIDVE